MHWMPSWGIGGKVFKRTPFSWSSYLIPSKGLGSLGAAICILCKTVLIPRPVPEQNMRLKSIYPSGNGKQVNLGGLTLLTQDGHFLRFCFPQECILTDRAGNRKEIYSSNPTFSFKKVANFVDDNFISGNLGIFFLVIRFTSGHYWLCIGTLPGDSVTSYLNRYTQNRRKLKKKKENYKSVI